MLSAPAGKSAVHLIVPSCWNEAVRVDGGKKADAAPPLTKTLWSTGSISKLGEKVSKALPRNTGQFGNGTPLAESPLISPREKVSWNKMLLFGLIANSLTVCPTKFVSEEIQLGKPSGAIE